MFSNMQGNQSREFLKKVDLLQQELEEMPEEALLNGLPYIHALRAFSKVVESCFSMKLLDTYVDDIKEFKRLYLALGVTVTPKVRIGLNKTIIHLYFCFRLTLFFSTYLNFWS